MSLERIAQEIEEYANKHGVELLVDYSSSCSSFVPIVNDKGVVGAIGMYNENNKVKTGYFILNDSVVRYALEEGFKKEHIYNCFKDSLFKELNKEQFLKIMTEKRY